MTNRNQSQTDASKQKEVETAAKEILRESGYRQLIDVDCQYDLRGHTLTLRGCVSSFYWKQIAQEILRGISHIDRVVNLISI